MVTPCCLFAYGTLLRHAVWRNVAGRPAESVASWCSGYVAYEVAGADYPGLVPAAAFEKTHGRVYLDLDAATLHRLDLYEGSQYSRQVIRVECADGQQRDTWCYLWRAELNHLLSSTRWVAEGHAASCEPPSQANSDCL